MDPAGDGVAVNAPPREFFKLNPPAPVFAVGQVNAPGFWPPSSLKELIGKTGLTASADPRNARITHISPAGERTVEAVDLQAILDGTVPDVPLQSGDVVTIPTRQ
jgi:protein involved in polysaccharide export with SLBB domain